MGHEDLAPLLVAGMNVAFLSWAWSSPDTFERAMRKIGVVRAWDMIVSSARALFDLVERKVR